MSVSQELAARVEAQNTIAPGTMALGALSLPLIRSHGFDFARIDDSAVREQVVQETVIIRATTSHAFMIVGRSLARIKELLEGSGLFNNFVEEEFGFTGRTANRYINGYRMLSAYQITPEQIDAAHLGKSTIHMLTSQRAPREVVASVMEKIRSGQHVSATEVSAALAGTEETHREELAALEDEVRELNRKVEQERIKATGLELESVRRREQLDRAVSRLDSAYSEIDELTVQIEEFKNKLRDTAERAQRSSSQGVEVREIEVLPAGCQDLQVALDLLEARKRAAQAEAEQIESELRNKQAELDALCEHVKEAAMSAAQLTDLESRIDALIEDYPHSVIEACKSSEQSTQRLKAMAAALLKFAHRLGQGEPT